MRPLIRPTRPSWRRSSGRRASRSRARPAPSRSTTKIDGAADVEELGAEAEACRPTRAGGTLGWRMTSARPRDDLADAQRHAALETGWVSGSTISVATMRTTPRQRHGRRRPSCQGPIWSRPPPTSGAMAGATPKINATRLISRCACSPSNMSRMMVRLTIVAPPAAQALDDPPDQQQLERRRDRAGDGRDGEHRDRSEDDRAPAEGVRERAVEDAHRGEREQVGRHDQLELARC